MDVKPTKKVTAAGIGGAFGVIVVWVLEATTHVNVPGTVGTAIGVVCSFFGGYIKQEQD